MFGALGRLVSRRPWYVIAAWLVATVLVVLFHPKVEATTDQADFLPDSYDSIKAANLMADAFPDQTDSGATVVFDRTDGAKLAAADVTKIGAIMSGLDLPEVFTTATPPIASPTNEVAISNLQLAEGVTGQDEKELDQVKDLRDELKKATDGTGLRALTTGSLPQSYDQIQSGSNAEAIVGLATLVLIVVLLGIIFRSVIITLLPILSVIFFLMPMTNGLIDIAAKVFGLQKDPSTSVILIVVLFGVGTDYILFFVFRYRERLREGEEHRAAVAHAIERAGEAIASAGGAVIVAFLALLLSTLGMFRSIGPSLAIAVGVTVVAALTLIPALATVVGRAFFWPSKKWKVPSPGARFEKVGAAVGRRPVRYALLSGGVLAVLSVFALSFTPTFDIGSSSSSSTVESAKASKALEDGGFSAGATQPAPVVLHSDKALDPAALPAFKDALAEAKGVASVADPLPSADGRTAVFMTTLKDDPASDAALADLRDGLRPAAEKAAPDGSTAYVGGLTGIFVDFQAAMNRDYKVVFPVAAGIILLILALLLRSLVAPWYLMLSVGLGFAATLGATTIVFQFIGGEEGLIFMLPIYIYLFVVALGTDYNILMVARLREEAREGLEPRQAAAKAIHHSGPTIAAAGVILAGTFASLMLAGNSLLTSMGFAIAFGICVAAFVMSMFFTPALTALIGHAAWWPGHGDEARTGGDEEPEKELVPTA
ncbi:MMPL family transporter [Pimelobacter simplex]|uniref:MMPL domain protein n=1 Tax=Nocardioides simplex TaxID=2045 RepID=A0A0A1DME1_NOCSI|nr:MMPL family transporter [Pimelobacter simplex]AIY16535.1 MMPL domain protein [Pimelobacter simplex]MCG8154281.1 MMPL family transporter [Pimelobacter simplex]GEB11727.1 putative membrane protein [Pimelobacter simplex]SFN00937.1 putative drug exporter of the RND superfamily [Pimelobacter simplex]